MVSHSRCPGVRLCTESHGHGPSAGPKRHKGRQGKVIPIKTDETLLLERLL